MGVLHLLPARKPVTQSNSFLLTKLESTKKSQDQMVNLSMLHPRLRYCSRVSVQLGGNLFCQGQGHDCLPNFLFHRPRNRLPWLGWRAERETGSCSQGCCSS